MAGRVLRVKALCEDASGVLKAETDSAVQGLTGSLKIEGAPVVGRTLTAVFKSSDSVPVKYQWYQEGKTPIEGATGETYTCLLYTSFFSGNRFYTTAAGLIAGDRIEKVITCGEVIAACQNAE